MSSKIRKYYAKITQNLRKLKPSYLWQVIVLYLISGVPGPGPGDNFYPGDSIYSELTYIDVSYANLLKGCVTEHPHRYTNYVKVACPYINIKYLTQSLRNKYANLRVSYAKYVQNICNMQIWFRNLRICCVLEI